jgi:DNA-binding response OmpR family regulator
MKNILWIDDEIDHFKSHILFLEKKGYNITTCKSGLEGIDIISKNSYDAILLDQNMPGLSGTETIEIIRTHHSSIPLLMISQNYDNDTVEDAIGLKISDYLVKPLNPNQILMSLTKIFREKRNN